MNKTVTVFGSSLPRPGDEEYETAYKLGQMLGKAGFNVCTGGYQGIMDAVSKGAAEEGAEAFGVTVDIFNAVPSAHLTKEIKCTSLFERLTKLVDLADAYIILRGGTGTLLELSVIWEYFNKGLLDNKPAACHGEMWKQLVKIIDDRMNLEGRAVGLIEPFLNVNELADYICRKLK